MSTSKEKRSLERDSVLIHELLMARDPKHAWALVRSLRFWKRIAVVLLPAVCVIAYRAWTDYATGPVVGGAFMSLGIGVILVHALLKRMLASNHGVFLRDYDPVEYWVSVGILVLFYGFVMLGILTAERD